MALEDGTQDITYGVDGPMAGWAFDGAVIDPWERVFGVEGDKERKKTCEFEGRGIRQVMPEINLLELVPSNYEESDHSWRRFPFDEMEKGVT